MNLGFMKSIDGGRESDHALAKISISVWRETCEFGLLQGLPAGSLVRTTSVRLNLGIHLLWLLGFFRTFQFRRLRGKAGRPLSGVFFPLA
jgi:hypothetical protein